MLNRIGLFVFILLVSACASLEPNTAYNWNMHQNNVLNADVWELQGRLNIRSEQDSQSITINWQQNKQSFSINLSGRFGLGAIQINGDEQQVIINKSNAAPIVASTLEEVSLNYFGYEFPMSELYYWVRGIPTPQTTLTSTFNQQGLLQSLQQTDKNQNSWQIEYDRYPLNQTIPLPGRIKVSLAPYRLIFNIDRWKLL